MSVVARFSLEQYELMAEADVFDGKHLVVGNPACVSHSQRLTG